MGAGICLRSTKRSADPLCTGITGALPSRPPEIDPVADFLSVRGDQSNSSRFVVDNTDSRFIRDDRGDCLPGVSPGTAIISRPTEQTQALPQSLSRVIAPDSAAEIIPFVLADRYKAPTVRPRCRKPSSSFLPRRSKSQRAVVPWVPQTDNPISQGSPQHRRRPQVSEQARDPRCQTARFEPPEASLATSCPILVILKAVFLIVRPERRTARGTPRIAACTTPGPLTPRLWRFRLPTVERTAMNGLSLRRWRTPQALHSPGCPGKQSGVPS